MKKLKLIGVLTAFVTLALGAGAVFAALGDQQTASGSVNVSTTSADLYICEPGNVAGPACGPDDNAGDEAVFETLEDLRPGDAKQWDIRLKNTGTVPFDITNVTWTRTETSDPGNDCPEEALQPGDNQHGTQQGVTVLGKSGDPVNDNSTQYNGNYNARIPGETNYQDIYVHIAPGDYEDLRLRLNLDKYNSRNCDGNTWDVAWQFTVN